VFVLPGLLSKLWTDINDNLYVGGLWDPVLMAYSAHNC